jgi:transaldolase
MRDRVTKQTIQQLVRDSLALKSALQLHPYTSSHTANPSLKQKSAIATTPNHNIERKYVRTLKRDKSKKVSFGKKLLNLTFRCGELVH